MQEQADYTTKEEVEEAMAMLGKGYDEQQEIIDPSDLRKYRIELPNLYDDADLDPYEFRLLAHYKRVGTCTEGTKTTAKKTHMSLGQVSEKRQNLHNKGFIIMQTVYLDDENKTYSYRITVVDKWRENFEKYSTLSRSEYPPSRSEGSPHTVKQRINHIKKKAKTNGDKSPRANTIPEVVLFREVTKRYPNSVNFEDVAVSVSKVKARLGRDVSKDDLLPFYKAWTSKGYNPSAITWLEWAETGIVPVNGTWKSQRPTEPKAFDAIRKFMARGENG
jgi:hypothetical protein